MPVEGGVLDVLDGGDRESARVVATVHPFASLDGLLPAIAGATGARVICINPRGVGGSSPPRPADLTLERVADDLDAVRRALDVPRWVVWGMSGGSMVAQIAVHRHPAALAGLVLDSAGPCFRAALADPDCVMSPRSPRHRAAIAAAGLAADELEDPLPADGAGWEEVPAAGWALVRHRPRAAVLVSTSMPAPLQREMMPPIVEFDARPWLPDVRVPVLVLGGAADVVAPLAHLRALHEAIPDAELAVIEGAGHVPLGERPAEVGAAVRGFLQDRVRA